jgi:hypothetical protein
MEGMHKKMRGGKQHVSHQPNMTVTRVIMSNDNFPKLSHITPSDLKLVHLPFLKVVLNESKELVQLCEELVQLCEELVQLCEELVQLCEELVQLCEEFGPMPVPKI